MRRLGLPRPAGKRELYDLVSDLASTPLDPARPLWQFHLVDRYAGGSAWIARIHHCYADGIALVKVLLAMTDEGAAAAGHAIRSPARIRRTACSRAGSRR